MDAAGLPALARQLERVYAHVPATRCAGCGACCQLTDWEYANHYATMFPLYRAEYVHIAAQVRRVLTEQRAASLLSFTMERPRCCPFLEAGHACAIYPVRPLICRTYAVMDAASIAAAAARQRRTVPLAWVQRFARRERGMTCARAVVTEPRKVPAHAYRLMTGAYERELTELSASVPVMDAERFRVFAAVTGRRAVPLRWSWGGFNALCATSPGWLRENLAAYWAEAVLPDAG